MNDPKDLDEIPLGASHAGAKAGRARLGVKRAKEQLQRWHKRPRWLQQLKNQRRKKGTLTEK